ncbi:MAG TPA: hypothetical protein VGP02_04660 [Mycobacteriales bacterium]|jgi:hypothetical protein|nr:hypothetical protein [Mycobacteriales bacterium]
MATPLMDWARAFVEASNSDPELRAHGTYYTCTYLLDMEEHTVVVWMVAGEIAELSVDVGPLDVPYQFLVRAGADTWRQMAVPTPDPMYHGIFAASFQRDMTLEGDVLVLMQNLRCFVRQIELLRTTGVPV